MRLYHCSTSVSASVSPSFAHPFTSSIAAKAVSAVSSSRSCKKPYLTQRAPAIFLLPLPRQDEDESDTDQDNDDNGHDDDLTSSIATRAVSVVSSSRFCSAMAARHAHMNGSLTTLHNRIARFQLPREEQKKRKPNERFL